MRYRPPRPQVRRIYGGRAVWSNPPRQADPYAADDPHGYLRHGLPGDVIEIRYPDGRLDRIPVQLAKDYLFDLVQRRSMPPTEVAAAYNLEPEAATAATVQDINQALLTGTLGLGASGLPVSTELVAPAQQRVAAEPRQSPETEMAPQVQYQIRSSDPVRSPTRQQAHAAVLAIEETLPEGSHSVGTGFNEAGTYDAVIWLGTAAPAQVRRDIMGLLTDFGRVQQPANDDVHLANGLTAFDFVWLPEGPAGSQHDVFEDWLASDFGWGRAPREFPVAVFSRTPHLWRVGRRAWLNHVHGSVYDDMKAAWQGNEHGVIVRVGPWRNIGLHVRVTEERLHATFVLADETVHTRLSIMRYDDAFLRVTRTEGDSQVVDFITIHFNSAMRAVADEAKNFEQEMLR